MVDFIFYCIFSFPSLGADMISFHPPRKVEPRSESPRRADAGLETGSSGPALQAVYLWFPDHSINSFIREGRGDSAVRQREKVDGGRTLSLPCQHPSGEASCQPGDGQ